MRSGITLFLCLVLGWGLFSPITNGLTFKTADSCKITLNKKTDKNYHDGIEFLKRKNYSLAQQMMQSVIRDEPGCVDAYFVMGLINFKKAENNFSKAEKNFLKVLELCPTYDPYTYYYLGEICYGREHYEEASKYLTEFLKEVDKIKTDEDYNRAVELLNYSKFYQEMLNHPVPFKPLVVQGISTPENEYLPILSPDNQMALFTREIKLPVNRNNLVPTAQMKEKFMYSERHDDGTFTQGEEMPEPFNVNDNEGGATLTADNNTLYYTVCKFDNVKKYLNCDIYFSENINGQWSPIKSISNKINLPASWESQPSISADGNILYFVSDRTGGYGGYDIYRAIKGQNGEWGTPINLGPLINSTGNEKSPFIHPDGKTLYFSSDGWMGLGGYDIFFSKQKDNNTWSKPVNIGYPINSPEDEVGFFVSTDGTQGYFASNKFNGKGGWDLYSFDLYDAARPEKVLFIKGNVKSESSDEPIKARIELKNIETLKISEIPMDSVTGDYVAIAPFNSDYIMTVKKEGFVFESKYIGKVDSSFRLPAKVDIEIKPIELNKSYRINDIYFPFNSSDLTAESKVVLDQLIEFLVENRSICIEIQGHTDNIGNDIANLKLSENRAHSVYKYLIEKKIPENRLTYKGFGKSVPVETNDTEEGRAKNRRTVFVITRK
ncbi:MAG: OmpA family protein [Bacteroidales bacterium]|nr:OmpA family protein [Bacteroidales bacterium]MDD4603065.1 OmpA family protein [Bacteroidales bacterium]